MITVSSLSKRFGEKVLFENVTLQLTSGCRYGLVGANGSGKTTFLKILSQDEPSDGNISYAKNIKLGVLRQDQFLSDSERILDVAMSGDKQIHSALVEQDRLSHMEKPDADRLIQLNDVIAHGDGYTLEARTRETLAGLGVPQRSIEAPLGTLSGGFKLRVLLAQVLVGRPDALLLDEPTNHLDILSIRWLELFLQSYTGCAVIISHDRRFLDAIATRTLDVDYQTVTEYSGNYTKFLELKETTRARMEIEIGKAEKAIAEKKAFVERFRAKATKARQAQSRLKQIERIEVKELPRSSRMAPRFKFDQERPSGRDVLKVDGISKSFGENHVLKDVAFEVRRAERVALIGANGIGKSTLLKILTRQLAADSGTAEWGHATRVGYFAQDHRELLSNPKQTPLSYVWDACPTETTGTVRGQLGRMLFSGNDVEKPVTALSGGEAARVIFARLAIEKPNVLVLDEPTNHLDLETIEALLEALEKYEGTLLFVSHDRYFVQRLATRVIELRADGLHDFRGGYDNYVEKDGADHLDADQVVLRAKSEKRRASNTKRGVSRDERKRRDQELKLRRARRETLLAEIERTETEKAELENRFARPELFAQITQEELKTLSQRQTALTKRLDQLMRDWETTENEISVLERELEQEALGGAP